MTSKDVFKLKRGENVLVHVNGFHQPIKSSSGLCTRFMTLLLKEPNLCPPDVKNWEECKSSCGITLLIEFRRRFSLPQGESVDKVILKKFNEKFRTLKFRLKDKLFKLAAKRLNEVNNIVEDGEQEMRYTDDELLEALDFLEPPNNFTVKQWETYKKNMRKPEAKILSQYGKKARAEKLHCHTLGAVSLARKRDEFKMKNGRDANAVEFFEDCYQTKAGSYVDKATNELMDHARQVISRKISKAGGSGLIDPEKQSEIESDVMIELLGPDKPGRARFHGVGVTKSQVTKFSTSLRRIRGDALTNENRLLLDKVDSQNKQIESQNLQIESQAKKIEYQSKQMETMERKIDGVTGELKLFQSVFKEIYPGLCVTRQDASDTQV